MESSSFFQKKKKPFLSRARKRFDAGVAGNINFTTYLEKKKMDSMFEEEIGQDYLRKSTTGPRVETSRGTRPLAITSDL